LKGVVIQFDKERGFGFIRCKKLADGVFVHVSKIPAPGVLRVGQKVSFKTEQTDKGIAAIDVVPGKMQKSPSVVYGLVSATITFGLVLCTVFLGLPWIAAYLFAINLVTLLIYGWDKAISDTALLRVPENVLHGLAFLGGSPAGLAAQRLFRHKTIKTRFIMVYWMIVVLQIALLVLFRHQLFGGPAAT